MSLWLQDLLTIFLTPLLLWLVCLCRETSSIIRTVLLCIGIGLCLAITPTRYRDILWIAALWTMMAPDTLPKWRGDRWHFWKRS